MKPNPQSQKTDTKKCEVKVEVKTWIFIPFFF